jgi:Flp pilus assembly protein TadD
MKMADDAYREGKHARALELYRKAAESEPDRDRAITAHLKAAKVICSFLPAQKEIAESELRAVLALNPEYQFDADFWGSKVKAVWDRVSGEPRPAPPPADVTDLLRLAEQDLTAGNAAGAIEKLRDGTRRFEKDCAVWALLSKAYEKASRDGEALAAIRKRDELAAGGSCGTAKPEEHAPAPPSAKELIDLGIRARESGARAEAVAAFRQAVELAPNDADNRNYLGLALFENDQVEDAIVEYQRALQIREGSFQARANLAAAYLKQMRYQEAIDHFRRALRIEQSNLDVLLQLGFALQKAGQFRDCAFTFREAANLAPRNEKIANNLGI